MISPEPSDDETAKWSNAMEIVRRRFAKGLAELCDDRFLSRRYEEFIRRDDPIYATLMEGMGDKELAKTFVSYWTIGQTLSVRSRFWLEDAVFEIIRQQVTRFGKSVSHVYTQAMLSNGYLLEKKLIAEIGEQELEHLQKAKTWEVPMKQNALREADLIVGEEEREVVDRSKNDKPFQRRVWTETQNTEARRKDAQYFKRMEDSIGVNTSRDKNCNVAYSSLSRINPTSEHMSRLSDSSTLRRFPNMTQGSRSE